MRSWFQPCFKQIMQRNRITGNIQRVCRGECAFHRWGISPVNGKILLIVSCKRELLCHPMFRKKLKTKIPVEFTFFPCCTICCSGPKEKSAPWSKEPILHLSVCKGELGVKEQTLQCSAQHWQGEGYRALQPTETLKRTLSKVLLFFWAKNCCLKSRTRSNWDSQPKCLRFKHYH